MKNFIENKRYIEMLHKNADYIKPNKHPNYQNSSDFKELQRELLKMELAMSSEEIINNTKIAFPNPTT